MVSLWIVLPVHVHLGLNFTTWRLETRHRLQLATVVLRALAHVAPLRSLLCQVAPSILPVQLTQLIAFQPTSGRRMMLYCRRLEVTACKAQISTRNLYSGCRKLSMLDKL